VRQALSPIEPLARDLDASSGTRGRTSISAFRARCPAGWTIPDRCEARCLSVHLPCRRSTQRHRFASCQASYVYATRLPFDPGSPAAGHAHPLTGVLRGGALEPESRTSHAKKACKSRRECASTISVRDAESLSLSGGASIRAVVSSNWASLLVELSEPPPKRGRRPVGSPSTGSACG
jgi:hypothetical protein